MVFVEVPLREGNTEVFLREALKTAEEAKASQELITLSDKEIRDCLHCNWCLRKQEEGKFCIQQDAMTEIYPKLLKADVILLATPVYFFRISGYMACFLDRLRVFDKGNYYGGRLRNKIGGALAVGWFRHAGIEIALLNMLTAFLALGMIPAIPLGSGMMIGAAGLSSEGGTGRFDPKDRLGLLKDEYGLASARRLVQQAIEMSQLIKAGEEALRRGLVK